MICTAGGCNEQQRACCRFFALTPAFMVDAGRQMEKQPVYAPRGTPALALEAKRCLTVTLERLR